MKKIVLVSSTFRKRGNSEILADEFEKGALEGGNQVKRINLRDIELKFCIGCLSCLKTGKCVQKDSVNALLEDVAQADILVFATPVYYYEMSGQMKTFLDRLNPLYGRDNAFKEVYLIATSAEDDKHAMDGAIKGLQGWIDCFDGVRLKKVIYGTGLEKTGEAQGSKAAKEAYEVGKSIKFNQEKSKRRKTIC